MFHTGRHSRGSRKLYKRRASRIARKISSTFMLPADHLYCQWEEFHNLMRQLPHSPGTGYRIRCLDDTADTSWYDAIPFRLYHLHCGTTGGLLAWSMTATALPVKFTLVNDINLNSESLLLLDPIGTASVTIGSNGQAIVDSKSPLLAFSMVTVLASTAFTSAVMLICGIFGCLTGEVKNLTLNGSIFDSC